MTTEAKIKTTVNYYRMSEALAKVYEIAREGKFGREADVKQLHNYLHSAMVEFKSRNHAALKDHTPEIVDVETINRP
jgi:hypothetical protein